MTPGPLVTALVRYCQTVPECEKSSERGRGAATKNRILLRDFRVRVCATVSVQREEAFCKAFSREKGRKGLQTPALLKHLYKESMRMSALRRSR